MTWLHSATANMPLVEIEIVEPKRRAKAQMTLAQAEEHIALVLEAREAAIQDAFMLRFFQEELGLGMHEASQLLIQLRRYRESLKRPPGERPTMA